MKLNTKFFKAAALAFLVPSAAMMTGCDNSAGADNRRDLVEYTEISGSVIEKNIKGTDDSVIQYSKDLVGTKNDLICIRNGVGNWQTMSCNWDKANGLVPAPAPAAP